MRIVFSAIITVLSTSTFCYAGQLTGTVKSMSGEPLSKVRIYSRSENQIAAIEHYLTTSNEQGYFKLLVHGKAVFFRLPGFRPIAKILQGDEDYIDVVMEPEQPPGPPTPICPSGFNPEVYVGPGKIGYRLPIPSNAIVEQSRGDHDLSYTVYYKEQEKKEVLVYYWSWMLIGFPKEELSRS